MDALTWRQMARPWRHEGRRIFTWRAGRGPALLLIHGFPTSSWDWAPLWQDLGLRWRTLAIDMLGFGFSDKPAQLDYTFAAQAKLHEDWLASLGVHEVLILAHDYGDTVAQELLARDLERRRQDEPGLRLRGVCFLNGGLFIEAARPRPIQRLLLHPVTGPVVSALMNQRRFERSFLEVFSPAHRPSKAELEDFWWIISTNKGHRIAHRLGQYLRERVTGRDRWVAAMQSGQVPLRLVCGMDDPVSGATIAARYRELMPSPDLIELPGIGHYPQLEAPGLVLRALEAFAAPILGADPGRASRV